MEEVFIVGAKRTPFGSFLGSLAGIAAPKLGATAIKGALTHSGINASKVNEVFFGNVVQAGVGQAPARQAAIFAGISNEVPCTTINKVCASGMKSISLGAQSIMLGHNDCVVVGGMENMSQIPHYSHMRNGTKFGDAKMVDGLVKDGLLDVYDQCAMGFAADATAKKHNISREAQDEFAINSYKKTATAWEKGWIKDEIVPVEIPQRRGEPIIFDEDEEYKNVRFDKIPNLRPVFDKEGTVTAANASTINDGAVALVLVSGKFVKENNLKPLAKIIGFADAAHEPKWFTTAPAKALPKAYKMAGLKQDEIDYFELNEAFSVVGIVNINLLGLNPKQVNVHGGAVSIGHPLGASGARIVLALISALRNNNKKYGAAGICNGGGGAGAMVIEAIY